MNNYDKALLEAVKVRLPKEVNPVWFIADVLCMSKEAAYRRLRGEVSLTLKEAALLSNKLGISLNKIINADFSKIHYYGIFLADFEIPGEDDYRILQAYLDNLDHGRDDPHSQLAVTANIFPQQLYLRYKGITQFALFKWIYQEGERQAKAYHEVKVAERMQQVFRDSREIHQQIRTTYYIFDHQLSLSLANDLRYFTSVGLLRPEDAESIRSEAHKLLDYMEQIAITGKNENGNEVYMYISDINFNKSYYNIKAGDYYLSAIESCVLNSLASTEKNCYQKMNAWIHSRRRLSILITQSAEPQRIAFFNRQHCQLDS